MCARDRRCTDGVTECEDCNGYGVTTMGGRKYKRRSGGRNIGATAIKHAVCNGTGLRRCGCQPISQADARYLESGVCDAA